MHHRPHPWRRGAAAAGLTLATLAATVALDVPAQAGQTFLGRFGTISEVGSTVPPVVGSAPGGGDVNPYGVAVVSRTVGRLTRGDVLVSNFNDALNEQGRGRTIMELSPSGAMSTFAVLPQQPGGVGLTTALGILSGGFVAVGNLPTSNGLSATARRGGVLILDRNGTLVDDITGTDIDGPWDMAVSDFGSYGVLYISNVLNSTVAAQGAVVDGGTVIRLVVDVRSGFPRVVSNTVIASGLAERTDPAALVVGPTGVALAPDGTLYVADTVNSAIRAIPNADYRTDSAGTGRLVTSAVGALNGPLGLTIVPDGDILTVNAGDGEAVETTPGGVQVATRFLDTNGTPPGNGALFGLAVAPGDGGLYFVDDATNQLDFLHR